MDERLEPTMARFMNELNQEIQDTMEHYDYNTLLNEMDERLESTMARFMNELNQ